MSRWLASGFVWELFKAQHDVVPGMWLRVQEPQPVMAKDQTPREPTIVCIGDYDFAGSSTGCGCCADRIFDGAIVTHYIPADRPEEP